MRIHGNDEGRPPAESGLTTEDIAHPQASAAPEGEERAPMYPGEATQKDEARTETASNEQDEPEGAATGSADTEVDSAPFLGDEESRAYRERWSDIQGRFVDDPQDAVKSADELVAEVIQALAKSFSAHKQEFESQWDRGEEVATEDLRIALQRYRTFFERLLKA